MKKSFLVRSSFPIINEFQIHTMSSIYGLEDPMSLGIYLFKMRNILQRSAFVDYL